MTSREYLDELFRDETGADNVAPCSDKAAGEFTQLVSGSFVPVLVELLWLEFHDLERITDHLEQLYDTGQHYGVVYLAYILANSVDLIIPLQFAEASSRADLIQPMAEALLEDWLVCVDEFADRGLPLS